MSTAWSPETAGAWMVLPPPQNEERRSRWPSVVLTGEGVLVRMAEAQRPEAG